MPLKSGTQKSRPMGGEEGENSTNVVKLFFMLSDALLD